MTIYRGVEWSLQAFASMRGVRSFLRVRAEIKFAFRGGSTLEIPDDEDGEQPALRKFCASRNLHFLNNVVSR